MSGAAIAERLVLSPETVRTHVRNAMDKLGASTRSQAVALAVEHGDIGEGVDSSQPAPARPRSTAPESGVGDTLHHLVAGIATLADLDTAAAYLLDESGMALTLVDHAGEVPGAGDGPASEVALGANGVGRVALERRAQLVTAPWRPGSAPGPILSAPMVAGGRLVGVLCMGVRPSRPVSRREVLLVEAFATRVGEVLATKRNREAALQRALERFRASWTGALAG